MKKLFLLVMITLTTPGSALAQSTESMPAAKVTLARRLYDEGVDAVDKGHWSIAYDRFKASYELAPRVLTLYNLAGAQGQTGRLVEATEIYRRFLRETTDGRYPELRLDATNQLEMLEKQIAQLTLDVTNIEPTDIITIDQIEFPHAALHEAIPVNPGPHVAVVQRGAIVIATRTITLASGATEAVRIELPVKPLDLAIHQTPDPPIVTTPAASPKPVDHGASHTWLHSPWLWSGVAAVVVGSAGGAYLLTRPNGVTIK